MRKSTLAIACFIGLMMFASCKKDPIAPTITVLQSEGYLAENAQVYADEDVVIGFVATGEKLVELETKVTKDGTLVSRNIESIDNQASYTSYYRLSLSVTGTVTITGTVTDAAGQTASVSFNVICNEKPNAKFIGHYEGEALATGFYDVNSSNFDPIHEEFEDRAMVVSLDLAEGENMNEVIATCVIDDRTSTAKGTVNGDKVTFEAINDVITINYEINGFTVQPKINMTYNVNGTLTNGQLVLNGTFEGSGEVFVILFSGNLNMEGTVGGALNKIQ